MKRIVLSDYAGDQLRLAADKRQADYEAWVNEYHKKLFERASKATALRQRSLEAWKSKRYFDWIGSLFARLNHTLSPKPVKPRRLLMGDSEQVLIAGSSGEQVVSNYFAAALDDSWTMIEGYKNYKGEIDRILVGKLGALAIEIKTVNGVVYVNGDQWYRNKYDRYGNLVERGLPIVDRGGRSPSAQINQTTDALEAFLSKQTSIKRVKRAVIFAHERSRIGGVENQSVDMIASIGSITNDAFRNVFTSSEEIDVEKVIALIKRDHQFNAKRGKRGDKYANR